MLELTLHTKLVEYEGKKFTASTTEIKGKWFKVKFKQGCQTPNDRGLWHLTVSKENINVQVGGIKTSANGNQYLENDTIWVESVTKLSKFTDEEMKAINELKVNQALGL